jgi:tetratricopeptide (TPR) repeat protein
MPQQGQLYLVRGILRCQLGEFTKAFDDFQTANQLDPGLSYANVAKGIVESQVHKPAEALAEFRAAAKEHPNEALTQYLLSEALSDQDNPDLAEAITAASRAIQLDPKLVAAHDLIAGIYLQQGVKQKAIEHSDAALALDPNDQQALYHLMLALRGTDRKGEIPGLLKRMNKLHQTGNPVDSPQKRLHQLYEAQDVK